MASNPVAAIENWKGAGRRYAKFWHDAPVREAVISQHAKSISIRDAVRELVTEFGPERAPSKSALHRTWKQLDELRGGSPRVGFVDVEMARQRRAAESVVGGKVKDVAQRVHIILQVESGPQKSVLDRGLRLIASIGDRIRGDAGRSAVGGENVAKHQLTDRVNVRLDISQPTVDLRVHLNAPPAISVLPPNPVEEGGQ